MRRPVPLLLSLATLALAAAGCEKKASSPAAPPSTPGATAQGGPAGGGAPPSGDVILLGEVGSLTGSQATFGQSTQRGVQMGLPTSPSAACRWPSTRPTLRAA
jgi:branched-chain amino acid transport system substrate-binding protein